jgi:hypothetical protein
MRLSRGTPMVLGAMALLMVLGACTATQSPVGEAQGAHAPGFWKGLWQGFIAPLAFLVSLISDDVRIYAFPNAGRWYDFGFMLGIGGFSGGLFAGSKTRTVIVERRVP